MKIEEGIGDGAKTPTVGDAARVKGLIVGAEVAYKQTKVKEDDGQWIQCNIIRVLDVGNKKR